MRAHSGKADHSCHRPCRSGLSLVDLTITVLIIGIGSAVALPRFSATLSRMRTEAVARRIASDLNFARRTAMLTSRTATVTFNGPAGSYSMTNVKNPHRPAESYAVSLADVDAGVAFATVSFNGGSTLSFNNYGRPLVGSSALTSAMVTLSSGGFTSSVTVDPSTGEAGVP